MKSMKGYGASKETNNHKTGKSGSGPTRKMGPAVGKTKKK